MTTELMNVRQVAEFYRVSESTIRRRIKERKAGDGSFPIPIFGFGKVARWRRSDIEDWNEIEPEVVHIETPAQQNSKVQLARQGLSDFGIKISKGT